MTPRAAQRVNWRRAWMCAKVLAIVAIVFLTLHWYLEAIVVGGVILGVYLAIAALFERAANRPGKSPAWMDRLEDYQSTEEFIQEIERINARCLP